jgi:uncharacterized membrane protein
MTILARRRVRILLYVVFGLALVTTVLNLFLGGPPDIGVPAAIVAVILGGLLDSDSNTPRRKR